MGADLSEITWCPVTKSSRDSEMQFGAIADHYLSQYVRDDPSIDVV